MNLKLYTIIVLLVLISIFLCVLIYFRNTEHFQETLPVNYEIQDDKGIKITELKDITKYKEIPNPVDVNVNMVMLKMEKDSIIKINRQPENLKKNFTFGFYFKPVDSTNSKPLLEAKDSDNKTRIDIQYIAGSGTDLNFDDDNEFGMIIKFYNTASLKIKVKKPEDTEQYYYLAIQSNTNNIANVPKAEVIVNNKSYKINIELNREEDIDPSDLNIKNFHITNFNGYLGNIMLFNKLLSKKQFCENFDCNLECFILDDYKTSSYNGNVNNCIKDCMTECDNIDKCQNICLNCDDGFRIRTKEEKMNLCSWIKESTIQNMTVPDAPSIRGYPGNNSILIEWKEPFNGRSEISNYIIMYHESFNKKNGIKISISTSSNVDIIEHEIKNLKNKTYYDIIIRAVNAKGIGKPSNIVTIAPNGDRLLNTNRDIFNELEDDLNKEIKETKLEYVCESNDFDSVGHILDSIDSADIDIKNHIKNIKPKEKINFNIPDNEWWKNTL